MRARGLWAGNVQALSSASQPPQLRLPRPLQQQAHGEGHVRHAPPSHQLLRPRRRQLGIHAGVAVSSDANPKHVHVRAAGQTAAEIDVGMCVTMRCGTL